MYEGSNGHLYPFPLGRIVQHDERSRRFALPESDISTLKSVKWTRYAPVFDQGNLGSCTGNAAVGLIGTSPFYDTLMAVNRLPALNENTAVDVYSRATAIDEWPGQFPPEDTGSSGLAVAKILKEMQLISEYRHAFSFNAAITALAQAPVITGVTWYDSFFYPTTAGQCAIGANSSSAGGHEICIDELDVERQRVWFTNSWGPTWGINGRAWFSWQTWQQLLADSGDVTQITPLVGVPVTPPTPTPTPEDPDGCLAKIIGPWAVKKLGLKRVSKADKIVANAALTWIQQKNLSMT